MAGLLRARVELVAKEPAFEVLKTAGDPLPMAEFASALDALAHEGDDLFYRGEIAALMVDRLAAGGQLSRRDLETYEVVRRAPVELDWRGHRLLTNPAPSLGGTMVAMALALMEKTDLARDGFGGPAHVTALAGALRLSGEARDSLQADAARLLHPDVLRRYREALAKHPAMTRGTTHISVIDALGNAASATVSNGEGAGVLVPGTGIMLNNMLGEDDINPDGFHAWPLGVRLASMMAPSVIRSPGGGLLALGSGGSKRIRSAIPQVIINRFCFGQELAEAVAAPRLHGEGKLLSHEAGFSERAISAAGAFYPENQAWAEASFFFGGVQAVERGAKGDVQAAGDPRRGGEACLV
ncbi:MAG: gamma-glutamyltransferase [Rhodospirillales bacterium]